MTKGNKNFRVRSSIKSFRDLEVYKKSTLLSAEIFLVSLPEKYRKKKALQEELEKLKQISKWVPKLISEAYGDKFTSLNLACGKLERALRTIDALITKADFINAIVEKEEFKEKILQLIKHYQVCRRKILNLSRSWTRVFGSSNNSFQGGKKNEKKPTDKKEK